MNKVALDSIDWQRPWLAHLLPVARQCSPLSDWRIEFNRIAQEKGLLNHRNIPIRFVDQESLPIGKAYEAFISETGGIPTRNNLHDFFNAVIWLTFPRSKAQLNALQAAEIAKSFLARSPGSVEMGDRGRLRDAATIFDENAALIITGDLTAVDALRAHDWVELFLRKREVFGSVCDICLFGHALIEKLVTPFKSITAHSWLVIVEPSYFTLDLNERLRWLDVRLSDDLKKGLKTSEFMPLPVLGIPDWCSGQDFDFYTDTAVFRPKRQSRS